MKILYLKAQDFLNQNTPKELISGVSDCLNSDGPPVSTTNDKLSRPTTVNAQSKPSTANSAPSNLQTTQMTVIQPTQPNSACEMIDMLENILSNLNSFSFTDKSKMYDFYDVSTKTTCSITTVRRFCVTHIL